MRFVALQFFHSIFFSSGLAVNAIFPRHLSKVFRLPQKSDARVMQNES